MRAFQKLPDAEKQKMLPVVLLAPWLNSIKFDNSINIVKKSIGDQPIIVDIDRYYQSKSELESRLYFWSLLEKNYGPKHWMKLVEKNDNYIPCLQLLGVDDELIEEQVEWARNLGRGFCLRFELERHPNIKNDIDIIEKFVDDDCLIILDFGYGDFSQNNRNNTFELLNKIFTISDGLRVTISGSNFPNNFSEFDEFAKNQPIATRQLFSEVRLQFGNYNVFYGDWASTKPRKYDGHGSAPLPRIDYPTSNSWIMARSKEQNWSLEDASLRITRLPEWQDHPKVWGTGMIEKTALGLPGGIKTHPEAIAVRINIHLFTQANYGVPNAPVQPKGKWKDPI